MPHFTLSIDPGGPLVSAFVGVSFPRADALKAANQTAPQPIAIRALVDTGASSTCIDPKVFPQLGLSPTGSTLVHTPSTDGVPAKRDVYDVSFYIPPAVAGHPMLRFQTIPVMCTELASQGIDCLIGRDILGDCILVYNGAIGSFTIAY